MKRAVFALLLLAPLGCPSADADPKPAEDVFRIPVTVHTGAEDYTFQAEIADTPAERSQGLMFRESMETDHGMIFLFPTEKQLSFWMKNTLIPLDMIFIRADRTVLGVVENAVPKTTTSRMVPGDSQFVLEINGGLAAKYGIKEGQRVTFMAPLPDR